MKTNTYLIAALATFWLTSFALQAQSTNGKTNNNKWKNKKYTVDTYKIDESGWGYNIYENDTLVINQTRIPAIAEKIGFKTQSDAKKTGGLVAYKLSNGVFPPAISVEELDSLQVYKIKNK